MNIQVPATHTLISRKSNAVSITHKFDVGNAVINQRQAEMANDKAATKL
jgi:hypothetical protein